MTKYLSKDILLSSVESKRLSVGRSLPSFCESCGCQRIHVVVGFAKRGRCVLVELKCLHEYENGVCI